MHRSGTSLTARLFGTLGCSYGGELMPPKDDNQEGFWEHAEVVKIHDRFLAENGRTWSDPRPWVDHDFASPAAERAKARLAEVFANDFRDEPIWVLKDPRLSRLLPLWREIWSSAGHRITFCHTVRNPLAVARSLEKRNGYPQTGSLLLWLRHVLEAERFTRGFSRAWVAFEDLANEPLEQLRAACRRMEIDSEFNFGAAAQAASDAVRRDRIHHVIEGGAHLAWPWIAETRQAILAQLDGETPSSHETFDRLRSELLEADRLPFSVGFTDLMGALQDECVERSVRLEQVDAMARRHVEKLEAELTERQSEIDRAKRYSTTLEAEVAECKTYGKKLEADLAQAEALREDLETALDEAKDYVARLEQEIETKNAYESGLETQIRQLATRVEGSSE